MKLLLDTHAFLWWNMDSPQLSPAAKSTIQSNSSEIFLSAASSWEIAIKYFKGKLELPEPPDKYISSRLSYYGFLALPIQISHTLRTFQLPDIHHDPFDRLLIAQCQMEDMAIITGDEYIKQYEVEIIW
jgi:PIN domain nuclease of toxin-antitoxin system